ncbi:MAG: cytidylate kinase-like family protein [Deltaproteobacteria bacterium]|nr:MAG: cytidylate kinase-like family protein [Deltaproteobacteria bacterium]
MSIITISRGSYSRGKDVAEKLAQTLGYECISRDILLEASEQFNIPEIRLVRAIHDAPSVFERFTYGKERYIAYIRAALLANVQKDNVVYHGLAGHFFLQGVPHVLKVRIIADMEDRVSEEMKRENISPEKARHILKKDDEERRKWGLNLYGHDTQDSRLYDLVLHIQTMTVDDAVKIVLNAVQLPCYQTTPESQRILDNLTLAAEVQASLAEEFPTANVASKDGGIYIVIKGSFFTQENKVITKVKNMAEKIAGVKDVNVYIDRIVTDD